MNIEDLAGQMNEQHRETQARLIKLDEDVADVQKNVVKIESTMQTKEVCEKHRNKVHDSIRKAGALNRIISSLAIPIAAVIGWLTAKFGNGG